MRVLVWVITLVLFNFAGNALYGLVKEAIRKPEQLMKEEFPLKFLWVFYLFIAWALFLAYVL